MDLVSLGYLNLEESAVRPRRSLRRTGSARALRALAVTLLRAVAAPAGGA